MVATQKWLLAVLAVVALTGAAAPAGLAQQKQFALFNGQVVEVNLSGEETSPLTDRIVNADQNQVLAKHEGQISALEQWRADHESAVATPAHGRQYHCPPPAPIGQYSAAPVPPITTGASAPQGGSTMSVTLPQLLGGLTMLAAIGLAIWAIVAANIRAAAGGGQNGMGALTGAANGAAQQTPPGSTVKVSGCTPNGGHYALTVTPAAVPPGGTVNYNTYNYPPGTTPPAPAGTTPVAQPPAGNQPAPAKPASTGRHRPAVQPAPTS